MINANGVDAPLTTELIQLSSNRPSMHSMEAKRYRRAVARINYMSQDRCDLSSASKVMPQSMSSPRVGDEAIVKRVIRYIHKYPRCVNQMEFQQEIGPLKVMTDSDWEGDTTTRISTSGGLIFLGRHMICHWSKLQSTIALSSGEAELNASVKGLSEAIGVNELIREWSIPGYGEFKMHMDASVAKGTLTRRGSGKIKHLTTKQLWVQESIRTYGVKVEKISRSPNPPLRQG